MAGSAGKLPRRQRQLSDIHKRLFGAEWCDDLAVMMERCECLNKEEASFVHSDRAAPQPLCLLARDTPLKHSCSCAELTQAASVCLALILRSTWSHFMSMVFLHKALTSMRTGKNPVFTVHHVQIIFPSLHNIRALGNDGELAGAFYNVFPDAIFIDGASSIFRTIVTQSFVL